MWRNGGGAADVQFVGATPRARDGCKQPPTVNMKSSMWRWTAVLAGALLLLPCAGEAKKKKKRDPNEFPPVVAPKPNKKEAKLQTQTLPQVRDPQPVAVAEVERLGFAVTPLSGKGLLTQQTRDALRWLLMNDRGGRVVKLRAFVAGSGDSRRIQEIASEVFGDRRLPVPALSVVQVGALPLEDAQVQFEALIAERKAVNPHGLAFFSAQAGTLEHPDRSLRAALESAQLGSEDVRSVTCYMNALEGHAAVTAKVRQAFPAAVTVGVQALRGGAQNTVACEAVARLREAPDAPAKMLPAGADGFAQAVLLAPGRIVLTGTQLGFGKENSDLRLALERLGRNLEAAGASHGSVVYTHVYAMLRSTGDNVARQRAALPGASASIAGTNIVFEGLPSVDASFGIDVIARVENPR